MIEINNLTKFAVDKAFFLGVAKKVLKGENEQSANVSIAFVSEEEMQRLNNRYRQKDKPTDVLSFRHEEYAEVVLCPEYMKNEKSSMAEMLIHGLLHVLGYDHEISEAEEGRMFKKQEEYFSKI